MTKDKKSKKLGLLLIAVLIVWGIVIFRIIDMRTDDDDDGVIAIRTVSTDELIGKVETKMVSLDFADPFLKGGKRAAATEIRPKPTIERVAKQVTPKEEEPELPNVKFKGIISNGKAGTELGIIQIEEVEFFVRKGQQLKELTVVEMDSDQIVMEFKGKRLEVQRVKED